MSLAELRDVIIILSGSLLILLFLITFVFAVVLGMASRTILTTLQGLLHEDVTPMMDSARLTAKQVHGTTTFVSETTVTPVIRAYAVVAGARRAFGVLVGLAGRSGRQPGEESIHD